MDIIDDANATEAKFQKMALERQQSRIRSLRPSEKYCLECGDEIPQARREAAPGCQYCVTCQSERE